MTKLERFSITMLAAAIAMLVAVAIFSGNANAAPFVESEPYPASSSPKPTICQVFIDSAAGVDSPVITDATGTYCHYDISSVAVGAHTVKAKFAVVDPVWGRVESVFSNTANFTRPGPLAAPASVILAPN